MSNSQIVSPFFSFFPKIRLFSQFDPATAIMIEMVALTTIPATATLLILLLEYATVKLSQSTPRRLTEGWHELGECVKHGTLLDVAMLFVKVE